MQLTIEFPDQLEYRLKSMPNINDYIIKVLAKSLEIPAPKEDAWTEFLSNLDHYAVETGINDLAENHDSYLQPK